jgi:hypothetical protein
MESIFMDKSIKPTNQDLMDKLGPTFSLWSDLKKYLNETLKDPSEEWNFPGKKYGWSFRMKSKKRNIIYFLPRERFFKVALVFGQKATDIVMKSNVNQTIKTELQNAKVYAEGRGIRIDIRSENIFEDIKTLIRIKVEN